VDRPRLKAQPTLRFAFIGVSVRGTSGNVDRLVEALVAGVNAAVCRVGVRAPKAVLRFARDRLRHEAHDFVDSRRP
jgi:hypothetical protein